MGSIIIVIMALFFSGCEDLTFAYSRTDMVKAIIGEAEGESQVGKEAVACAIRNRGNLLGVYGLHSSRVKKHKYSRDTYINATIAVMMADDRDYCENLIHGAQYWESKFYPNPYWAKSMTLTATIDNQKFYRKD